MKQLFTLGVLLAVFACKAAPVVESRTAIAPPVEQAAAESPKTTGEPVKDPARRGPQAQSQDALAIAKPWIDDAMQIRDVKVREAAVAKMHTALGSSDTMQAYAGLIALNQTRPVAFDKKPFRALVLPHLSARDPSMRIAAMYALDAAGREDGDLERVLAAAEGVTGEARNQLVHVIATFSGGELVGAAGEAVSKIIASDDRQDVRRSFSGLWGARVSPAIEKRLLDLSNGQDHGNAHDAIYFGLSTLRDKSEAVVDRLIELLADPDFNNSGRALWGLGQGVPNALEPKVADAMLQLFEARSDPRTRADALRLVGRYGVERHAVAVESFPRDTTAGTELSARLSQTAAEIRARLKSQAK